MGSLKKSLWDVGFELREENDGAGLFGFLWESIGEGGKGVLISDIESGLRIVFVSYHEDDKRAFVEFSSLDGEDLALVSKAANAEQREGLACEVAHRIGVYADETFDSLAAHYRN